MNNGAPYLLVADDPEIQLRMADDSLGPLITGIPSPSGRQTGELEAASYGIMNDGR